MPACWRWGTGPSFLTSCPYGWECQARLGQRCLFQVSCAGWQAPCLCWQGGSRAGGRGKMSLAPRAFSRPGCGSLQRVGIPLGPVAGTGGGCSQQGFFGGIGGGRYGTSVHPHRPAAVAEPRWRSQRGRGQWCTVLTPREMQLTGHGSSGTRLSVCMPAWGCGLVGITLCPPHPSCPHARSPLPCPEAPEAPRWV